MYPLTIGQQTTGLNQTQGPGILEQQASRDHYSFTLTAEDLDGHAYLTYYVDDWDFDNNEHGLRMHLTRDDGTTVHLEEPLEPGVYVLEVTSAGPTRYGFTPRLVEAPPYCCDT